MLPKFVHAAWLFALLTSTLRAADPATVLVYAGNNQNAAVGTAVTGVVCARVLDTAGADVPDGTTVTFAVASGGGTITGANPTTTKGIATLGSWTLGPTSGTNTLTANCAAATPATFSAIGTAKTTQSLAFASPPSASPPAPLPGQTVNFSASATGGVGPLTYTWSFGDGPASATGPSVTHIYSLAGTFNATVTVSDGASSIYMPLAVTVGSSSGGGPAASSIIGSGVDSDGDGFSDSFEALYGTNPSDAASSPINNITLSTPAALTLLTPVIKLSFAAPGKDIIKFKGLLNVPGSFVPAGQNVVVVVGNELKTFTLTAKASAKDNDGSLVIALKSSNGVVIAQQANFTVQLKGALAAKLSDWGLINGNASNVLVKVPFFVYFNGALSGQLQGMQYNSKMSKSGSAL